MKILFTEYKYNNMCLVNCVGICKVLKKIFLFSYHLEFLGMLIFFVIFADKLMGDILPKVKRQARGNVIVAVNSNDVGLEFTVNAESFLGKAFIDEEKPMDDQAKDQEAETKAVPKYYIEKGMKDFFDTFQDEAAWQKYCSMNGVEEEWGKFYRYYYKNKYPDRDVPLILYHRSGYLPAPNKSQRNG